MSARLWSLVGVVVALIMYHVAQRSMPNAIRPAPLFAFVYGVAMLVMVVIILGDGLVAGIGAGSGPIGDQLHRTVTSWAPWMLAFSVAGIELGVYAMYRSGWSLSTASITSQSIAVAMLAMIGVLAFGEHLDPGRIVGLVCCGVGAFLLMR